jgi:lysophospholipase L1-like esterase
MKIFRKIKTFVLKLFRRRAQKFVYVAIGDSTVEGIGSTHPSRSYASLIFAALQQKNNHAIYHNLGKSGATSKDVLETQLEPAIAKRPDLLTISVGANDIRLRVSARTFEEHLQEILQRITEETTAKIIINNIPNFSTSPRVPRHLRKLSNIQIQRFNRIIAKLAGTYGAAYVDLYTQTALYTKTFPEMIAADQFHPSDFGYALWANTIITIMKDVL